MQLTPLTPITNLYICRNVPLDNTYTDTLSFGSVSEQIAYFRGKAKYHMSNLGPIKVQGQIRVPYNSDALYDCNYVCWQNSNFGNKWFYAFIKDIEWHNVNMSYLSVEIDVMQTWYFDYDLNTCFIERQHVANDAIGINLVRESLDLGEYVSTMKAKSPLWSPPVLNDDGTFENWFVVLALSSNIEGDYSPGQGAYKSYTGLTLAPFSSVDNVNQVLQNLNLVGKTDAVVAIYMCPKEFFKSGGLPKNDNVQASTSIARQTGDIDGYVPKNNKLFTYPYCFLSVSNLNGNIAQYQYEYFDSNYANFTIIGGGLPESEIVCVPNNYKGQSKNWDEILTLNNFPTCSYATDYYKAWLAQNKSAQSTQMLGTALSIGGTLIGTALTGGKNLAIKMAKAEISGATEGVMAVSNLMAQKEQAKVTPPQLHGNQTGSTMYSLGNFDFQFNAVTITAQFAKRIDDYFSMFGYAINDYGRPILNSRKSWNYIKTAVCKATGSIPFNDLSLIKAIYNKGITFWHSRDVGNYSQDNSIV